MEIMGLHVRSMDAYVSIPYPTLPAALSVHHSQVSTYAVIVIMHEVPACGTTISLAAYDLVSQNSPNCWQ